MMNNAEIRSEYLNFFKKNGHTYVPSSSLIPENDPTLLFTNAGMNQFKNTFLGLDARSYVRAVSSQKCVRAGGKHNDLDNVGFTARHHTFFEMLGNFSFGDYFKKEAIHYAWEFLTKTLSIPKEKLYVTCYTTDDEAADIWHRQEGVPKERIFRFEKDNFWRMGDVGPCGPCSEIFYDHGAKAGRESDPYKGIAAGEDRFVEIWNLVFMQFYDEAPGKQILLPRPSVDTGAGFERLVAALQGQFSNYDTDVFSPMIEQASQLSGQNYVMDPEVLRTDSKIRENVAAMRVLADHCRSTSFLLADGALPSNEGRGYVLRRIIRRAVRYGRKLTTQHSLLPLLSETLIHHMGSIYPELIQRKDLILATLKDEEARFLQTLDNGSSILQDEISKLKKQNQRLVSGETAFKLYDTYGFPLDLTALIAAEQNLQVDEIGFEKVMQSAKEKAKSTWKGKGLQADEKHVIELTQKYAEPKTVFVGYDVLENSTQVLALSDGSQDVKSLNVGQSGFCLLPETPFYAEGGGQIADQGRIKSKSAEAQVLSCSKVNDIFIHHIEVISGELKISDHVTTQVESSHRRQVAANHSATHLMHAALRNVLGKHVSQAGSLVDMTKTRFDFTHGKPLTSDEIRRIEKLVNDEVAKAHSVQSNLMPHADAIESGAMALFGEKYGATVRVLKMSDFSTELCGGTHVKNTAEIRAFKILSESGVSAGVRRIEAVAGSAAIDYLLKNSDELMQARQNAGLSADKTLASWMEAKKDEVKELQKQVKKVQSNQINIDQLVASGIQFNAAGATAKLVMADVSVDDRDLLSQVADQIKNKIQNGVIVVIGQGESSFPVIVSVSKDLTKQFQAGGLLKDFAEVLGGKGGGRPDFAQGAVPTREKLKEAFAAVQKKVLN